MPDIPIPFAGEEIDPSDDASGILMTLVVVMVGFAIFAWLQDVGGYLANRANNTISGLVGFDPTSGQDAEVPGV